MIVRLLLVTILALVSGVCVADAEMEVGPIQSELQSAHSARSRPFMGRSPLRARGLRALSCPTRARPQNRLSTFCVLLTDDACDRLDLAQTPVFELEADHVRAAQQCK